MKYLILLLIVIPSLASATPGRTNSSGCHNSSTVGYHCHNSPTSSETNQSTYTSDTSSPNTSNSSGGFDMGITVGHQSDAHYFYTGVSANTSTVGVYGGYQYQLRGVTIGTEVSTFHGIGVSMGIPLDSSYIVGTLYEDAFSISIMFRIESKKPSLLGIITGLNPVE